MKQATCTVVVIYFHQTRKLLARSRDNLPRQDSILELCRVQFLLELGVRLLGMWTDHRVLDDIQGRGPLTCVWHHHRLRNRENSHTNIKPENEGVIEQQIILMVGLKVNVKIIESYHKLSNHREITQLFLDLYNLHIVVSLFCN